MEGIVQRGRPRAHPIQCGCGSIHRLTPSAMEVALQAFVDGDAQRVMSGEVVSMCIEELLDRLDHRKRKDRVRVA